ncbi:MAG: carboxymuconolactone decarboxylase family protein [Alphaproteobacteria bacterium]
MPDPHLKKIPRAELGDDLATLWDVAMRDRNEATLIEVAGNAPEVMDWYYNSFYAQMFHGGRVEVRIKQLARMKLSTMHGCEFCNRGNSKGALADGVSQEQLDALFDPDSALFDDRERAVLRLCEELTLANMDGYMDRHLYDALSEHFDDGEIFELGVCLAVLVGVAKFLFVFDLVSREDNCPIAPPGLVSAE